MDAFAQPMPPPPRLMKRGPALALVAALFLLSVFVPFERAQAQSGPRALVLFDHPIGEPYQNLGKAYAIMLTNLLGHWDARVDAVAAREYQPGAVEGYDAIFYLGTWFDHPLPQPLLEDLYQTRRTVVWFKYNFWQLARVPGFDSAARWGFRMSGVRGLEGDPAAPVPNLFDTVLYQGEALRKYYAWSAQTGQLLADPDIGLTEITDPQRALAYAMVANPASGEAAPYVLRSGNFWYVADSPFSFIGPRDRYLVFADLLHEMLGESTAAPAGRETQSMRAALVRLEDVNALSNTSHLRTLTDLMGNGYGPDGEASGAIPFSIALIPRYRDPYGRYNNARPLDIRLRQALGLRNEVAYALTRGAAVVMHGYTHQYFYRLNRYSAVSGDDFEFWDIVGNQPLPVDNPLEWGRRIDQAVRELNEAGFSAFAFETPHYQASPNAYRAIARRFPVAYERAVYYTSDRPRLTLDTRDKDFAVGQFFPYVIQRDWYGRKVLPENLGNIEYDIRDIDPTSYFDYTAQDLLTNARILRAVVRNGIASFFFHPFWLETLKRPDGTSYAYDGLADFKSVLSGLQEMGFMFVDPRGL